jgi:tetratricopeptide (TPR) repeat protein
MKRKIGHHILLWLFCGAFVAPVFGQTAQRYLQQGDAAYAAFDHAGAAHQYRLALTADSANFEAAWKLCRALIDVGENSPDKSERKRHYEDAVATARHAVALAPDSADGYVFLSIALGRLALESGGRDKLKLAHEIRENAEKALALDPQNDLAWHVLGRWHYQLVSLSWIERNLAKLLLGGLPKDASIDRAIECFENAVRIRPEVVAHRVELGKCYLKNGDKTKAREAFRQALSLPVNDSDDPQYQAEARQLLDKLN